MQLESMCRDAGKPIALPLSKDHNGILRTDWEPLLAELCNSDLEPARRAEIFHGSMATALLEQARQVRASRHVDHVGLTGGVFQNRVLTEQVIALLEADGFDVYFGSKLPCNDAALGLGQAAELAARELEN
jgi:hydrogenase maturation protein HypF